MLKKMTSRYCNYEEKLFPLQHTVIKKKKNRPLSLDDSNPSILLETLILENVFQTYMTMKKVFLG